jgi:hypothetical protein
LLSIAQSAHPNHAIEFGKPGDEVFDGTLPFDPHGEGDRLSRPDHFEPASDLIASFGQAVPLDSDAVDREAELGASNEGLAQKAAPVLI